MASPSYCNFFELELAGCFPIMLSFARCLFYHSNIADVPNFVDGINEQHKIMGQIEAVVQHPFFDKDELDAKVE